MTELQVCMEFMYLCFILWEFYGFFSVCFSFIFRNILILLPSHAPIHSKYAHINDLFVKDPSHDLTLDPLGMAWVHWAWVLPFKTVRFDAIKGRIAHKMYFNGILDVALKISYYWWHYTFNLKSLTMNSMELVIPLQFISLKKTPNDALPPQRQS